MSQNKYLIKKSKIFDYFANDLFTVLSQWKITISEQDRQNVTAYLCPISFRYFEINSLKEDELTLEHVPPESLGGDGIILTTKEINSRDGATIDKRLLQYIETRYFIEREGALPIYFSSEDSKIKALKLDFSVNSNKDGFTLSAPKNNIRVLDEMGIFKKWNGLNMKISGTVFQHPDKSAMLKIGYLLAFHKLGYQLILGPKQIANVPFKKIADYLAGDSAIDIPIVVLKDKSAPISKGILGIVASPIEYQCLVVNFSLGIKGKRNFNHCVFLPHPFDENFENLSRLKSVFEANTEINLQIESVDEYVDHFNGTPPVLWYHNLWKNIKDRTT